MRHAGIPESRTSHLGDSQPPHSHNRAISANLIGTFWCFIFDLPFSVAAKNFGARSGRSKCRSIQAWSS
ncbi:hypothetical protein M434DRAFT_125356 [Hypoxylon sp. CO27-5]|nr:hypothetical protein M434DRAFT_125356 [Hypoxylon sp. CO27-5]